MTDSLAGSLPSTGTSGTKGVSWDTKSSKWLAKPYIAGKQQHLGYFAQEQDAIDAVRVAREAADHQRFQQHLAGLRAAAATRRASGHD